MTDQRARAEQLIESLSSNYAGHNGNFIPEWTKAYEKDLDLIASALADERRGVWRDVWNEVARIQGNGSPMTDFGKGVIAATKDVQTFICEQSKAHAGQEG